MSKKICAVIMAALLMCSCALAGCAAQEEYVPQLKDPVVSPPTIGEADVLRVGVNTDRSPLAGKGNDKIIGIDVDVASALADELGLKVEIIDVGNDADKAIEENKVDIVTGIDSSDSVDFWLSKQYLPTGVALFQLADQNPSVPTPETKDLKIAAQTSSKSAWAVSNAFGSEALVSTSDLATAFANLKAGEVQYVASDAVIGMYAANLQGLDVQIVALMENASGYCIGVSNSNKDLQNAIVDALATMSSNGTITVIEDKWLGSAIELSNVVNVNAKAADENADAKGEGDDSTDDSSNTAADNS